MSKKEKPEAQDSTPESLEQIKEALDVIKGETLKGKDLLFHMKDEIGNLKGTVHQVTDFALETRLTAVMSSHTLPFITTQFKRVVAEAYAVRNSLVDVEAELSEKHASCEDLLRARSRLSEKHTFQTKNLEAYLSRYRQTVDALATEQAKTRQLELELRTQKDLAANVIAIENAIRQMASEKRLPADVIAELKKITNEIPKPTPAAPEETQPLGEEEI